MCIGQEGGADHRAGAIMPMSRRPATFLPDRAPSLRARYVCGASSTRVSTDDLDVSRLKQAITNHLLLGESRIRARSSRSFEAILRFKRRVARASKSAR